MSDIAEIRYLMEEASRWDQMGDAICKSACLEYINSIRSARGCYRSARGRYRKVAAINLSRVLSFDVGRMLASIARWLVSEWRG